MVPNRPWSAHVYCLLGALALALTASSAHAQYGTILTGTGAVNRSFGGVATAAPLSPGGALFWNPATLSAFERSELEIGAEVFYTDTSVSSTFAANSVAPGIPAVALSGETSSDSNGAPLPTLALVYTPEGSKLSMGLGVFALAGFGVDYKASTTNPILTAPPPNGIGLGAVYTDFQVLQIAPSFSYQLTDRISVAAGPTLDLARLQVDPGFFLSPDDANGDGVFSFPSQTHARSVYGGGFTVGAYYHGEKWGFGASYKSQQWFDTFRYNVTDELGNPREASFNVTLPAIVSVGASYRGWEKLLLAVDVRYLDYASTEGFGESGFTPSGALRGIGAESIFAVALGAQYQVSDALSVRAGYVRTENPIPDGLSSLNVGSQVILEHVVSVGATYQVTEALSFSAAYVHSLENSGEGPVIVSSGTIPNTTVRNSALTHSFILGASVKFGGCGRCAAPECAEADCVGCPTTEIWQ